MPRLNTAIRNAAILEDGLSQLHETHDIHSTNTLELVGLLAMYGCGDLSIGECMDAIDKWRRDNNYQVITVNADDLTIL
jgi:hypothetical protein